MVWGASIGNLTGAVDLVGSCGPLDTCIKELATLTLSAAVAPDHPDHQQRKESLKGTALLLAQHFRY